MKKNILSEINILLSRVLVSASGYSNSFTNKVTSGRTNALYHSSATLPRAAPTHCDAPFRFFSKLCQIKKNHPIFNEAFWQSYVIAMPEKLFQLAHSTETRDKASPGSSLKAQV